MKLPTSLLSVVLSSIAVSGGFTLLLNAQDMVTVSPDLCKVRLDNEWVRVTEVRGKAGDKMPLHSHPAHLTYFFISGKAKYTNADGQSTEREVKANTARWSEPEKHSVEFLSPEAFTLVVEVKKPTGKKAPAGADPAKVAADAYKVVLENDTIRLLEVRAKPGTKIPLHAHPAYVAYAVTDMKAEFVDDTGKTQQVDEKAGQTTWKEPETHAVNVQSADTRVLVIELKK
jgi:quercetin dioxygenase-like cupin family protein